MAIISDKLNKILSAVFGKDVRQALHDGLDAINKETESTTSRQDYLDRKYDEQIKNMTLQDPSSAEIVDMRVAANGKTFEKAGDRLNYFDEQLDNMDKKKMEYPILENEYINNQCVVVDIKQPYGYVERYGAKGDGVTDSTTAIQNAIDCAKANKYTSVFFGRGGKGKDFIISKTIFINNGDLRNIYFDFCQIKTADKFNYTNGFMMMTNSIDGLDVVTPFFTRRLILHSLWLNGNSKIGVKGIFIADRTEINRFLTQFFYNQHIEYVKERYIDRINLHDGTCLTDDATDYNRRTEYCITLPNSLGNNATIKNIEFSTGADHYRRPVKAIKVSGKYGYTMEIDNIMNGEIYISNTPCTIRRIHGESGSLILENSSCVVENSEFFNQSYDFTETFNPIIIKDYNGKSSDVVLNNCMFRNYAGVDYQAIPNLRYVVLYDTYKGNVTLNNCKSRGEIQYPFGKTCINVYKYNSTANNYTIIANVNSKKCLVSNDGIVEHVIYNKPTTIDSTLVSIGYCESTALNYTTSPIINDILGEINTGNMKFYGSNGTYTFKVLAYADYTRSVGFEIPIIQNVITDSNEKIISFKFNFNVENYLIRFYVYKDGDPLHTATVRIGEKDGLVIYNGRDFNFVKGYIFGEPINTVNSDWIKLEINGAIAYLIGGTPIKGQWSVGDKVLNTTTKKNYVLLW